MKQDFRKPRSRRMERRDRMEGSSFLWDWLPDILLLLALFW